MPPKALGEGGAKRGLVGLQGSGVVPAIFPEGHLRQDALMLSSGALHPPVSMLSTSLSALRAQRG